VHGQEPVAAVIFDGGDEGLSEAVRRANATLAEFQQMQRYVRWPDATLPYTSTGKLLRRQVAAWACAAVRGDGAAAKPEEMLLQLVAEVTGESRGQVDDAARLTEDLHLDSLGRVQLQSLLESRLGVEVSDDAMAQAQTIGELRRMVDGAVSAVTMGTAEPNAAQGVIASGAAAARESGANDAVAADGASVRAQQGERRETLPYPRWPWWWPMQWIRVVFQELVARPLIWLLAAPKVTRDAVALPSGPMLLIGNHVTAYDGPLMLYALPWRARRRVAIAMAGELLMDMRQGRRQGHAALGALAPFGYWLMTALYNVFPLPRSSGFRRSFAHAGEAMDRGYSVMVFPEGHRSETGELQPFRQGIGLLAQESQVAVLPIALEGLGELRASGRWIRSGKLAVHVGTPVRLGAEASAAAWTEALEAAMRRTLVRR
jgi:long-chain acyl-CoA synthetase